MSDAALRVYIGAMKSLVDVAASIACLAGLWFAASTLSGNEIERTQDQEAWLLILATMGIWQWRGWAIVALNWLLPKSAPPLPKTGE